MVIEINDIQQRIEQSLEDALYITLLGLGYLPDRIIHKNNPAAYRTAYQNIVNSKGFGVELFGHGAPHDRGLKTVPRIVINGLGFSKGNTGGLFEPSYINKGTHYDKVRETHILSDYEIEVQIVSNSTRQDRLLESVRQAVIPDLGYVSFFGNPEESFLVEQSYNRSAPDLVTGLIDKTYSYEVKDLVAQLPRLMGPIAKLRNLQVKEGDQILFNRNNITIIHSENSSIPENKSTILN